MDKPSKKRAKRSSAVRRTTAKAIAIGPRMLRVNITNQPVMERVLNLRAHAPAPARHAAVMASVDRGSHRWNTRRRLTGLLVSIETEMRETSQRVRSSATARSAAAFAVIALALLIPFHALIAYQSLQDTKGKVLGATVTNTLIQNNDMRERLARVGEVIQDLNPFLKSILVLTARGREGLAIVEVGQNLARVADEFKIIEQVAIISQPLERLATVRGAIARMTAAVKQAAQAMIFVHGEVVPVEFRPLLAQAQDRVPRLGQQLERLNKVLAISDRIVGAGQPQRYLVAFQNNHELRATGGFIGSYAIVEFDKGQFRIVAVPPYGSYTLDYGLRTLVSPPAPLQAITDRMTFHDANWDPDFPTSARTLLSWYEKSGGETLDGVMAINASLVQQILGAVGSLSLTAGESISADNFTATVEAFAATRRGTTAPPKELLSQLAPVLLTKISGSLTNVKTAGELLAVAASGLANRDIQLYHVDPVVQQVFSDLGYSGAFLPTITGDDYLFPVFTNIGGWKTDQVMKTNFILNTSVANNGDVEHSFTITRVHSGLANGPEGTVQENKSYIRVYVPEGATLLASDGFDLPPVVTGETTRVRVYKEHGRTVLAGWLVTPRGETRTVSLRWRVAQLLNSNQAAYRLIVQKQAGLEQATWQERHDGSLGQTTVVVPVGMMAGEAWPLTSDMVLNIKRK